MHGTNIKISIIIHGVTSQTTSCSLQ